MTRPDWAPHALTGLAAILLLASVAAQGGRWSVELDILTHIAPLYVAGALVCAVLSIPLCGSRQRRLVLGLCGLAIVASGALVVPELLSRRSDGRREDAAGSLKIIEFNAFYGNRETSSAVDWLLREQPDLIILEEGGALNARLAKAGYYVRCRGCDATLLSRAHPVASNAPGWSGTATFPRVATATFVDQLGSYTVMGLHRHWPTEIRASLKDVDDLQRMVSTFPGDRQIVAGDFNTTPWSFELRREDERLGLLRRTHALFTWPAERVSHNKVPALVAILPIDHVYAGPGWETVSVRRGPKLGSDHYPVIVVLRPRARH